MAPMYPLHDFKALYKYCIIITIIIIIIIIIIIMWTEEPAAGLTAQVATVSLV